MSGASSIEVAVELTRVSTPLQDLLGGMSWTEGRREVYQPITAPELASEWPLVRNCEDRLGMIRTYLEAAGIGEGSSYLDVGACYGWFVRQMLDQGYDAHGVELDPRGRESRAGRLRTRSDADRDQ